MKLFKFLPVIALVFISHLAWGQAPILGPIGDQTSMVGELFTLDVDALFADPPEIYELLEARPGMQIDRNTGMISWTPVSVEAGGVVQVRAYNSEGESMQQFVVYVADALPADPSLNSYWKLDETSGSTFVDEIGFHHATAFSPVTNDVGVVNNAQVLDPATISSEFMKVSHTTDHTWARNESFTFSFWFNWSGGSVNADTEILLAKGGLGDYKSLIQFYLKPNDDAGYPRLGFQIKNSDLTPADPVGGLHDVRSFKRINANQWYHVVGTYEGTDWPNNAKMTLYIDGQNEGSNGSVDFGQNGFVSIPPLEFGSWSWFNLGGGGNAFPFSGKLDEIAIYNKATTPVEINEIYAGGLGGKPLYPKPGNHAPAFSSLPITEATEGELYIYTATVQDFENDGLTKSADILPSWLTYNASNGLLSGTPTGVDVGDTIVKLDVSDGTVEVSQTFTISVENVEEAPAITSTPASTTVNQNEEFTYTVEVEDNDPGAVVTLTGLNIPDWMTFNPSTGLLSGTPSNDQVQFSADSSFEISIEARDNTDLFDTQEFSVTVINVNDAPVILGQNNVQTDRNVPITLDYEMLIVEDVDNHYPSEHTLTIKSGTDYTYDGLVLTPAQNFYGNLSVNIELSDGVDEVEYAMALQVNFVDNPPEVTSEPAMDTVKVEQTFAYLVVAVDPEGEDLTYIPTSIPSWMSWEPSINVLSGKPSRGDIGTSTVIITISDGTNITNHTFEITVISQWPVGLEQMTALTRNIYPNPADQYVVFEVLSNEAMNIEITDLSGKSLILDHVNGAGKHTIDVSALNSGLYLYRVYNEEQEESGKLVIK